jgi:hypothetical protein
MANLKNSSFMFSMSSELFPNLKLLYELKERDLHERRKLNYQKLIKFAQLIHIMQKEPPREKNRCLINSAISYGKA